MQCCSEIPQATTELSLDAPAESRSLPGAGGIGQEPADTVGDVVVAGDGGEGDTALASAQAAELRR